MPVDAYLSYIRFHHEEMRFVDFEIKLPPRGSAMERGESGEEREREKKREKNERE